MRLAETAGLQAAKVSTKQASSTIASPALQRAQRRVALATILIPAIGMVVAIASIPVIGFGLQALSLLLAMHLLTMLGITVGYHRHFAHRAFKSRGVVRFVLAALAGMAAQGPLIHWVSNHRRHHQFSDQEGDPHSPVLDEEGGLLRRIWHAHVGWMFTAEVTNPVRYAKDLIRDPIVARANRLYPLWVVLGLVVPAAVGGLWAGTWIGAAQGFLWGGLARVFIVHHTTWAINSITHLFGSRPFETSENSRNAPWLVIPSAGEAWHNNHHAFPASARFGLQWWQLDLGWMLIKLLEAVGLAWDVKVAVVREH